MSAHLEQRLLESAISVSDGESQDEVEEAEEIGMFRAHPAVTASGFLWAILSIGLWWTTFLGDDDVWLTGITSSLSLVGAAIFLYGCKASVTFPSFFAPWGKGLPHSPARAFCAALAGSTVLLCTSLALDKVPPVLACMRGCDGPQLGEECADLCAATRVRLAVTSYIAALGAAAVYCGISAVRSPCMSRLFRPEGPPSGDDQDDSDDSSSDDSEFSWNFRRSRRSGTHPMPRMGICCGAFLTDWLATAMSCMSAVLFPLGPGELNEEEDGLVAGASSRELSRWREEVRSALVLRGWQVRSLLLTRPVLLLSLVTKVAQVAATAYALVHSCTQGGPGSIAPPSFSALRSVPRQHPAGSSSDQYDGLDWLPGVIMPGEGNCVGVTGADIPRWCWLFVYSMLLAASLPIWAHRWCHRATADGSQHHSHPHDPPTLHGHQRPRNWRGRRQGPQGVWLAPGEDNEDDQGTAVTSQQHEAAVLRVQMAEEARLALDTLFLIWTLVGINCRFLDVSWAPGGSGFGPDPDGWDGEYATWGGSYAAARGKTLRAGGGDSGSTGGDVHGGWVAHTLGFLAWLRTGPPGGLASVAVAFRDPARVLTLKNVAFAHCLVAWLGVAALPIATFVLWLLVSAFVRLLAHSVFFLTLSMMPPTSPMARLVGVMSSPRRRGPLAGQGVAAPPPVRSVGGTGGMSRGGSGNGNGGGNGGVGPLTGGQVRRARDHEMRMGRGTRVTGGSMTSAVSPTPASVQRTRGGSAGRVVRVYERTYARMTAAHAVAAAAAAQKPDPVVLAAIGSLPVATFQKAAAPGGGGALVGCDRSQKGGSLSSDALHASGGSFMIFAQKASSASPAGGKAGGGPGTSPGEGGRNRGNSTTGKGKGKEVTDGSSGTAGAWRACVCSPCGDEEEDGSGSHADANDLCDSCGGLRHVPGVAPVNIVFTDTLANSGRNGRRSSEDGTLSSHDGPLRRPPAHEQGGAGMRTEGGVEEGVGVSSSLSQGCDGDSCRPADDYQHPHHHGDGQNWGGFVGGRFLPPEHALCALCLDDYVTGDRVKSLACPARHVFHDDCISQWLHGGARRVCPLCNLDALASVTPPPPPPMAQVERHGARHHAEGGGRERGREGDRRRHNEDRRAERYRGRHHGRGADGQDRV